MADNTQEVQEAIKEEFEQMALFDMPTLENETNDILGRISKALDDSANAKTNILSADHGKYKVIYDTGKYDARLDPDAPEFDVSFYNDQLAAASEEMKTAHGKLEKNIKKLETSQRPLIDAAATETLESMSKAVKQICELLYSETFEKIKKSVEDYSEYIAQNSDKLERITAAAEETETLYPFILQELEEQNAANPDRTPITLDDVLALMEPNGEPVEEVDGDPIKNPYAAIIRSAQARKERFEAAQEIIIIGEEAKAELAEIPRIFSNLPKNVEYPLDKINSNIWSLLEDAPGNAQIKFATEKRGSKNEATVLYGINFDEIPDEIGIIKKLDEFDKRCYIAASAIFRAGNDTMSASQIYTAMGNNGRPSSPDIEKINRSLSKMAARIYLNNQNETAVNKSYPAFIYDGDLLPFERVRVYIDNQLCESAIHIFREPPLITFARGRKQLTTIPRALLASPISKTPANLRIDDYLIERISHIKGGKMSNKLLYKTIYENCGITTQKQKQRAPGKIHTYLKHYAQCGFIKGFTESADGITINF